MISPFRKRQQMVRGLMSGASVRAAGIKAAAAPAPAPEPAADTPAGQEYASLKVLLDDNLRALSDIASHEARNPKKAEFAKAFAPWIDGVLAADADGAPQDDILVTNMIWAVDYKDIDYALRLGAYGIRHNLILPGGYTRTVACFLAEDIAHLSLSKADAVSLDQLVQLRTMVADSDMPDPVMARLGKAIGRAFVRKAEAFDPAADNAAAGGKAAYQAEALANFQRALELDAQVGVKKDIEQLQRALKAAGIDADASDDAGSDAAGDAAAPRDDASKLTPTPAPTVPARAPDAASAAAPSAAKRTAGRAKAARAKSKAPKTPSANPKAPPAKTTKS